MRRKKEVDPATKALLDQYEKSNPFQTLSEEQRKKFEEVRKDKKVGAVGAAVREHFCLIVSLRLAGGSWRDIGEYLKRHHKIPMKAERPTYLQKCFEAEKLRRAQEWAAKRQAQAAPHQQQPQRPAAPAQPFQPNAQPQAPQVRQVPAPGQTQGQTKG
ncbi:MAG: hypothetical protein AB1916_06815 [Thermodesulfobacteriota bacterium]